MQAASRYFYSLTHSRRSFLLFLVLSLALSGCATTRPYRTAINRDHQPCGVVGSASNCAHSTPEVTPEYELHFVEFDDQGWLHPAGATVRDEAATQLDWLMHHLRQKVEQGKDTDLSIVLFVHGWKHNAAYDDTNVEQFRRVLRGVHAMEQAATEQRARKPREIIGIYVGWRGMSLKLPEPLINVTFWDRKAAALRVAQGSVRELLSRLNRFHKYHTQECRPVETVGYPRCKVRLLLIGHSFGAWVLYSAIAESLVANLTAAQDTGETANKAGRYADMVLLINPAFEGSRYEQLHHAAQRRVYKHYQAPVLVIVTSKVDWATRYAFPLGRTINTLFQLPTSSAMQTQAIRNTVGHIERYRTHELTMENQAPAECAGWRDSSKLPEDARSEQLRRNVQAERENQEAFFKQMAQQSGDALKLPKGWRRQFCGGAVLTHRNHKLNPVHPHTPIWNVRADASMIAGHNEIDSTEFLAFVRQLYHDAIEELVRRDRVRGVGERSSAGAARVDRDGDARIHGQRAAGQRGPRDRDLTGDGVPGCRGRR